MVRKRSAFLNLNPWIVGSIGLIALFWIVSLVVGFLWYPAVEGRFITGSTISGVAASGAADKPRGLLQLICGGLGFANAQVYSTQPGPQPMISSHLAWTEETWQKIRNGDSLRGATISTSCTACHGQDGVSAADYIPNLAGLPPEVIYKELIDYQSGKRNYVVMNAVAAGLSDQDSADLAVYYSSRPITTPAPLGKRSHLTGSTENQNWDEHISRLFSDGDPMRNVVACAACHGPEGLKTGAPPLIHQPVQYVFNQLTAFSEGSRTNDINRQMRLIAGRLTPDEINGLAKYLGSRTSRPADRNLGGLETAGH